MDRFLKRIKAKSSDVTKGGGGGGGGGDSPEEVLKKFLVQDFHPRVLTKKLYGGRRSKDNELYRSNSFKFERFERSDSQMDLTQLPNQVQICDDYSLPVDYVNKKRPLSVGASLFWDAASPCSENVEVLDLYCDPRDSKAYLEPGEEASTKVYTTPDKEYCHPYSSDCSHSSDCKSAEGDAELYENVSAADDEVCLLKDNQDYYADVNSDSSEDRMSPRIDDMSRRQQYETAFDSKVSKSEDELDVDEVTHKSILVTVEGRSHKREETKCDKSLNDVETEETLLKEVSQLELGSRTFVAPTPPSSAPLPVKFRPNRVSSVTSSPDIPLRSKDLKLPIKSTKTRIGGLRLELLHACSSQKAKPKSTDILEIKGRPRGGKYSSSTESMATSSSGGSLESIRSSTSEGNRSTSSCESRRSSSLSSHSSDSTGSSSGFHHTGLSALSSSRVFQQNKLNILSPISDKSSQEQCSETSENNKNNNSEKASPEEVCSPVSESQKNKRRTPQNRNLINLGLCFEQEAHQGSDSGISIESRVGNINPMDFSDLPFDMPKLRRRRMLQESTSVQDTSGSATSVDLRDLPFDMPKLRRRQRPNTFTAPPPPSSNCSQDQPNPVNPRPSLSLDLQDVERRKPCLGLEFPPRPIEVINVIQGPEPIDVTVPLEQQGWYHGAITRLEAENILRMNKEGSFLVRNSESTKQDYSLSLKSARGFMHMRIQQCKETGRFILGQFSNPFLNIPEMIKHYSVNRLPIRGAEHMCLSHPVIEQLL